MKLKIELQRFGSSRVSPDAIPIVAHVVGGPKRGQDLLAGQQMRTVECAKQTVQFHLDQKFRCPVEIEWIDRTAERE